MASIINTYDANSTLVYPRTSTDALDFNDGVKQGAEAIAAALSKNHENLVIGNIEIVADRKLKTPEVVAGVVNASNITASGNLVVDGNTNINSLNVRTGKVSVKDGGIDVSGNIDVSNGYVKADKANFKDCSFGDIHIDGNANKIYVTGGTTLVNGPYNYTLQQLATQTGVGRHPIYTDTSLYVTGAVSNADNSSSRTYTDPSVCIKNGNLYTKGLYVGGDRQANQINPTNIVLKQTSTNLISNGNEFNFIPSGYINSVAINYKAEGNLTGKITKYAFYDGSRGLAQLDASLYRCRGGRTCLYADDSSNGHLVIGSQDPSIRTYIQKDRVVVENATGKSTFSMDSIELDPTKRYIKSTGTRLLTGNSSANYTQIYSNDNFIGLSVAGANTETKLNLLPSQIYIESPLVQMDSHARVGGDVSVDGKLYVQGDVSIGGAFNIGSNSITLSGNKYTQSSAYSIVPNTPKLIVLTNSTSQAPVHIQIGYLPAGNVHFIMSSTTSDSTYFKYFTRSGAWKSIKGSAMLVGNPNGDYGIIGIGASI